MENISYKISAEEYSPHLASALALYSNERNASGLLQMLDHHFLQENDKPEISLLLMQMMQHKRPDLKAELGRYFRYGIGVRKNKGIAQELYLDAMESNSKTALVNMAWSLYDDNEYIKVIELLEDFLKYKEEIDDESLLEDAYSLLGDSYSRTENPDYDKCIKTLIYCGERYHNGYSYFRLSSLYKQDIEKLKDIDKSVRYLKKAAEYKWTQAMLLLAEAYTYGDLNLGIEISYNDAKETVKPLMNSTDFDCVKRLISIYWQSAHYGKENSYDDNKTVVELYNRLVDLYGQEDPKYAEFWPNLNSLVGKSYMSIDQNKNAVVLLKKAYDAGVHTFSDFYAYLLKDEMGKSPDEYLPIFKEHYNEYHDFNNTMLLCEYLQSTFSTERYEDCLQVAADHYEKEKDILYYEYISRIILYGLVKNNTKYKPADVANEAAGCYEYVDKQANGSSYERESKIIFASALGYYFNETDALWKAVNWYLKANSCDDADAALALGRIYERSAGTFKADSNLAYQWYVRAANLGNEVARREAACFKKTFLRGMVRM